MITLKSNFDGGTNVFCWSIKCLMETLNFLFISKHINIEVVIIFISRYMRYGFFTIATYHASLLVALRSLFWDSGWYQTLIICNFLFDGCIIFKLQKIGIFKGNNLN